MFCKECDLTAACGHYGHISSHCPSPGDEIDCSSVLCTSSAEDRRGLCKMLEYRCLVLRILIESLPKESPHKLPGSKALLCRHFIHGKMPRS